MPISSFEVKKSALLDQPFIKLIKKSKKNQTKISKWGDLLTLKLSQDVLVPQDNFFSFLIQMPNSIASQSNLSVQDNTFDKLKSFSHQRDNRL